MMWKNVVEPGRPQMTSWILKDTDTHSEYVILIAFPRQQLLHERALMLLCTYIACLLWVLLFFTAVFFRYYTVVTKGINSCILENINY